MINLRLTRDPSKHGRTDEWAAAVTSDDEGRRWRGGIGRTRTEAAGSFFMANLRAFGVGEVEDVDPEAPDPVVVWQADRKGE
jgi:hypothetical protein